MRHLKGQYILVIISIIIINIIFRSLTVVMFIQGRQTVLTMSNNISTYLNMCQMNVFRGDQVGIQMLSCKKKKKTLWGN